jgi:hypothetical protein
VFARSHSLKSDSQQEIRLRRTIIMKANKTIAAVAIATALLANPMSAQASGGARIDDCFVRFDHVVRASFVRVHGWFFYRHAARVAY